MSEKLATTAETAYRTYLNHTRTCSTCRQGGPCSSAVRLGHAWREARR